MLDMVIVGGGAVGLSTAYKLLKRYPDLKLRVLEKEAEVSAHQTGHNSGVIHSGLYYRPGSYRATLCFRGREELVPFAQEHGVDVEVPGKVVVATEEEELPRLEKIHKTGIENGLEGIIPLDEKGLKDYEPECGGIAAIYVPQTGIIDYKGLCVKLAELISQMGSHAQVQTGVEVQGLQKGKDYYTLNTNKGALKSKYLISCAGLQSDRLARMEGLRPTARIVGFRGDYYDLTPEAAKVRVRNLIYPVPNPAFPFLGVHFTRMTDGVIECGPNAVFTFKREGYGKTDFSWRDTREALGYKGTWRLFWKHWRFGLNEYNRAFSKRAFYKQVRRLVPSLQYNELVPGRSGVRAMALGPDGNMLDDFVFAQGPEHPNSIHVLNAPSPAATACLAIGDEIADRAAQQFGLA